MKPYDEQKFHLGSLCSRGHEFGATGQSLRYNRPTNCVVCAKDYRRERDRRARESRLANSPPALPDHLHKCAGCGEIGPKELSSAGKLKHRCAACRRLYRIAYQARRPDVFERSKATMRKRRRENWAETLWRGSRSSCVPRKLAHSITPADVAALWDKQAGKCFWTGVVLRPDAPPRHPLRPSLDRIDPERGYERDNIALSCLLVNLGRGPASAQETRRALVEVVEAMAEHHQKLAAAYQKWSRA